MRILFLVLMLVACGKDGSSQAEEPITADFQSLREDIESWVKPCSFEGIEYPCEGDNEDHSTLWSGFMCMAGFPEMCNACLASQDALGKFWRAPSQVGVGKGDGKDDSSRDMALGALMCFVGSKNADAAWRYYRYIRASGDRVCTNDSDGRCDVSRKRFRAFWGTYKRVFQYLDMSVPPKMARAAHGDEQILVGQIAGPDNDGYQQQLNAIHLHIRKHVGKWSGVLARGGKIMIAKQPENPYFLYVYKGGNSDVKRMVWEKCPRERPEVSNVWAWEKADNREAWKRSMGYDCLFMIKLLETQ